MERQLKEHLARALCALFEGWTQEQAAVGERRFELDECVHGVGRVNREGRPKVPVVERGVNVLGFSVTRVSTLDRTPLGVAL